MNSILRVKSKEYLVCYLDSGFSVNLYKWPGNNVTKLFTHMVQLLSFTTFKYECTAHSAFNPVLYAQSHLESRTLVEKINNYIAASTLALFAFIATVQSRC